MLIGKSMINKCHVVIYILHTDVILDQISNYNYKIYLKSKGVRNVQLMNTCPTLYICIDLMNYLYCVHTMKTKKCGSSDYNQCRLKESFAMY